MKLKIIFEKSLIISLGILFLGSSIAFAKIANSHPRNESTYTLTKKNQPQQISNPLPLHIEPIKTLAEILGLSIQTIEKDSDADFSDIYQYARKKGVLNKYKAKRMLLAKENIQKSLKLKYIGEKESTKILRKICYNITNEKPEEMGISAKYNVRYKDGIFLEKQDKMSNKKRKILFHLKKAIKNNELSLVYQPQIDINSGKTIGMEALLRWKSKELGNISPSVFIPIAEKNDLIIEIGNWVTNQVCKDLEAMNENYPKEIKNLRCSINFSPIQITDTNFYENLLSIISKYKIEYNQLELEITEGVLLSDLQKNKEIFQQLKQLGITTALDDFGSGYSSFPYLRILPIDRIKVDRSFIKDYPQNDDGTLMEILVHISKKLNKKILIEGAETQIQIQFLKSIGSDYVQGYYYSKPLLKDQLIKFIQKTNKPSNKISSK